MNSTEKLYLETKEKEAVDDLKEHGELAKVIIKRLADARAARIQNGYVVGVLSDVCAMVCEIIEKEGLHISKVWTQQVLPKEYKDQTHTRVEYRDDMATHDLPEIDEDSANDDEILDGVRKYEDAALETSRRKNAYVDKARRLREAAIKRNLNLKKEQQVTSTEDNPGPSLSHTALTKLANLLDIVANKMYKFKPVAHDEDIAREIEILFLALRPMADEKWTDALPAWFKIQENNIAYGKHAAGSMGATTTPDGITRKFTREQVGDRKDAIIEMACRLLHEPVLDKNDYMVDMGGVLKFDEEAYNAVAEELLKKAEDLLGPEGILWLYVLSVLWHKKSVAPRIAKRKVQMHDQFSESA